MTAYVSSFSLKRTAIISYVWGLRAFHRNVADGSTVAQLGADIQIIRSSSQSWNDDTMRSFSYMSLAEQNSALASFVERDRAGELVEWERPGVLRVEMDFRDAAAIARVVLDEIRAFDQACDDLDVPLTPLEATGRHWYEELVTLLHDSRSTASTSIWKYGSA